MAHKASTRERHCCRSAALLVMVFHVRPHSFISFSTVRLHVSFGRPRLLFPSAVQRKAVLGSAPGDIRHTCPSHLHLLFFICVVKDVASVLRCSSSLVMVLGQNTPMIFRRHLFWKVSSLYASLAVSFQHSGDGGMKNNLTIFRCRMKIIKPNNNYSKKCINHLDKFNSKANLISRSSG